MLNILNPMLTLSSLRYYVISFIKLCKLDLYSILRCLPVFHPSVVKYRNCDLVNYDFVTARYS